MLRENVVFLDAPSWYILSLKQKEIYSNIIDCFFSVSTPPVVEQVSDLPSKRRSGLGSVVFVRAIDALVVRHRDSWNRIEVAIAQTLTKTIF